MADTDYNEKAQAGIDKAKSAAKDTAGHNANDDKGDSGEKTEGAPQKNADRDGSAASTFVEAKKKI